MDLAPFRQALTHVLPHLTTGCGHSHDQTWHLHVEVSGQQPLTEQQGQVFQEHDACTTGCTGDGVTAGTTPGWTDVAAGTKGCTGVTAGTTPGWTDAAEGTTGCTGVTAGITPA